MSRSPTSQPPKPGELWVLDDAWKPTNIQISGDKKIALVLKEMCINGGEDPDLDGNYTYSADPLDPIYRSLVEGQIVDLHWTWFRFRLSQK